MSLVAGRQGTQAQRAAAAEPCLGGLRLGLGRPRLGVAGRLVQSALFVDLATGGADHGSVELVVVVGSGGGCVVEG